MNRLLAALFTKGVRVPKPTHEKVTRAISWLTGRKIHDPAGPPRTLSKTAPSVRACKEWDPRDAKPKGLADENEIGPCFGAGHQSSHPDFGDGWWCGEPPGQLAPRTSDPVT